MTRIFNFVSFAEYSSGQLAHLLQRAMDEISFDFTDYTISISSGDASTTQCTICSYLDARLKDPFNKSIDRFYFKKMDVFVEHEIRSCGNFHKARDLENLVLDLASNVEDGDHVFINLINCTASVIFTLYPAIHFLEKFRFCEIDGIYAITKIGLGKYSDENCWSEDRYEVRDVTGNYFFGSLLDLIHPVNDSKKNLKLLQSLIEL